eukprot:4435955-Pleurochrysis_carterae.AAC.2
MQVFSHALSHQHCSIPLLDKSGAPTVPRARDHGVPLLCYAVYLPTYLPIPCLIHVRSGAQRDMRSEAPGRGLRERCAVR